MLDITHCRLYVRWIDDGLIEADHLQPKGPSIYDVHKKSDF